MPNNESPFGSMNEETRVSQFVPESPDTTDEFAEPVPHYPAHPTIAFEPLEPGDAQTLDDSDVWIQESRQVVDAPEPVVRPMAILETPDGYTAPEFERSSSAVDQELDALFSEMADTSSGQSVDIAVWCPWMARA